MRREVTIGVVVGVVVALTAFVGGVIREEPSSKHWAAWLIRKSMGRV